MATFWVKQMKKHGHGGSKIRNPWHNGTMAHLADAVGMGMATRMFGVLLYVNVNHLKWSII